MKIAHVVPVMTTVPPNKYGGIEQVVTELALGLKNKGHEITIFAARGSGKFTVPGITIAESAPFPTIKHLSKNRYWEIHQWLKIIAEQDNYDFIHFHYEPLIARNFIDKNEYNLLEFIHKPVLITFHNTTHIPENITYYKKNKSLHKFNYAFLSDNHRQPLKFLPHTHIVHNGIPVEKFTFNNKPKDYLLFLGRITPAKGILEAIAVAKLVNKKLLIVAKIDPTDQEYYKTKVKHLIDGKQIVYAGEANFKQKLDFYKNAMCVLFPIQWEEPFGLVMVEAMACGTPVIAFKRGSVPEIIAHGKTGFIVSTVEAMAKAVDQIPTLNREEIKAYTEQRFGSKMMVNAYEKLYRQISNPKSKK